MANEQEVTLIENEAHLSESIRDRQAAAGDREAAAGDPQAAAGDRQAAAGDLQAAAGDQQPAAGHRLLQWIRMHWLRLCRVGVGLAMIVFAVLIVALAAGLLIAYFIIQREMCLMRNGTESVNNSQKDNSGYSSGSSQLEQLGYEFTIAMWGCIYTLEIIEYLILGRAIFKFLSHAGSWDDYKNTLQQFQCPAVCKFTCISSLLLLPYLILVIAVPTLNILKELEYEKLSSCYNHDRNKYFAYTAVNYLRYLCAFIVRVSFVITTLVIRKKWDTKNLNAAEDGNVVGHDGLYREWYVTANRLHVWTDRYTTTGKKVKNIMKIFQTWFIIPWLIYFITSSVDINSTIQPWSDKYGSTTARISYLIFNINKLVGLLVPLFCAVLINSYHHKFYKHMKKDLIREGESNSQHAIAHIQFNIEKEEDYDFVAYIEWTDIEVHVNSPIFILLGLFFAITKPLLF